MREERRVGYTAINRQLAKWENGRTPKDGAPDALLDKTFFYDEDGNEVTDENLIQELNRRYQQLVLPGTSSGEEI